MGANPCVQVESCHTVAAYCLITFGCQHTFGNAVQIYDWLNQPVFQKQTHANVYQYFHLTVWIFLVEQSDHTWTSCFIIISKVLDVNTGHKLAENAMFCLCLEMIKVGVQQSGIMGGAACCRSLHTKPSFVFQFRQRPPGALRGHGSFCVL